MYIQTKKENFFFFCTPSTQKLSFSVYYLCTETILHLQLDSARYCYCTETRFNLVTIHFTGTPHLPPHTHTYTHVRTQARSRVRTHIHAYTHARTHARIHTHTHTHTHSSTFSFFLVYIFAFLLFRYNSSFEICLFIFSFLSLFVFAEARCML